MQLLNERTGVPWLPAGGVVRLFQSAALPPLELTSGAFVLLFRGEDLLLVKDKDAARGWDVPGGHKEGAETLEVTARRELFEEGAAKAGELIPFALVEVEIPGEKPAGYQYPVPKSYMAFFIGKLHSIGELSGAFETEDRKFFPPEEARQLDWVKRHPELYENALTMIRRLNTL